MYNKQTKPEAVKTAREWLLRHSEILDQEYDIVKKFKNDQRKWQEFTIEILEETKDRMDLHLKAIERRVENYKVLPRTLTAQFEIAKKRKAAVKGEITKTQNKIRRQLGK